jgi:hypothetical protein
VRLSGSLKSNQHENIFISPEALVEKLRKMNFQTMPITPHRYCNPSLHGLYSAMSSTETPVLAAHRVHMKIQNLEEKWNSASGTLCSRTDVLSQKIQNCDNKIT